VEKHGQHHDDASKEVMASTNVIVINSLRDYALAQLSTPKHLCCKEFHFWKMLMIGELGIPSSKQKELITTTTAAKWGLEGEDLACYSMSSHWHRHVAQLTTMSNTTAPAYNHAS
jgi:hypothetical protein